MLKVFRVFVKFADEGEIELQPTLAESEADVQATLDITDFLFSAILGTENLPTRRIVEDKEATKIQGWLNVETAPLN